jgi:uncharacterized membrane protein
VEALTVLVSLVYLSTLLLGLLSGVLLFVIVVSAPAWRAWPPADVRAWFTDNEPRLTVLMFPLSAGSVAASGAALFVGIVTDTTAVAWLGFAAAGAAGVGTVTLLFNEPINQVLTAPAPPGGDLVESLLGRWLVWHRVRFGLALFAFACAVFAVRAL